ncbi:MAG: hypothetical protein Q4C54_10015 [Clostridia bacterium]|nr:hypothetical protein [Clostridia bacterium]
MKKIAAILLTAILSLFVLGAFAEECPYTLDEFKVLVEEELAAARDVVYYPHAYEGDFEQLYVNYHKLSRARYETVAPATEPGVVLGHYDYYLNLKTLRESMVQIADPASTVWDIWEDDMAVEDPLPTEGWEISYDNPGFRPFLNPYLLDDQSQVKGNVIVIAGGGSTHRNNVVEGYPVAEFFNQNGYNAFVLQRRVNPYAGVDQVLDLSRSIRYIRYYAEEKNIAKTDVVICVGFSAGGGNIMTAIANQYGHVTPDTVYPNYVCDEIDAMSADMNVAIPVYGLFTMNLSGDQSALDFSANENLPAVFGVVGQKDPLSAYMLPSLTECAKTFPDFSFYLAPDAPHGVGLGTGTRNYVNGFTQLAQWPEMAINFIESRLDLQPKTYDLNQTMQSW